jgi:tRNA(adenine34) deaminase
MQGWDDLEPAWHEAFQLAWEAFGAGTIPVGAVVTDEEGSIIARGRNRMFDTSPAVVQIFGSRVAHAEINALVGLGTERRYFDCTLWTTLEPCAQCVGAAWLSTIGSVVFAATDVYGGASKLIERQIEAADSARDFHMAVEGPLTGPPAVFSELLHVAFFVGGRRATTWRTSTASGGRSSRRWRSVCGCTSTRVRPSTSCCPESGTSWGTSRSRRAACCGARKAIQSVGDRSEAGGLGTRSRRA